MLDDITQKEMKIILDSTHDAMIAVNADGVVNIFNCAAERLTGLKASEVKGKLASKVIPNTRLHIVLQKGKPELNQQQVLGSTTIITNRVPVKDEKGSIQGAVAIFRDISEIKTLTDQITDLWEVRHLLEAIIDSTEDAISVVDENGIGILVNPAYTRITGLSKEDVLNKPATVDIAEGESTHMKVLRTRKPVRDVKMKVGPMKKEVVVKVAPIIIEGKLKGSVGVIHDISEIARLNEELARAKSLIRRLEAKYTCLDIIGNSNEMKAAKDEARRAAGTPATVLLRGESGTGKELFAHAIHNASSRSKGQFLRVNCAAISEQLLESELFGYVEGAFTGASKGGKRGLFEEAAGGTIFLDEIGEVGPNIQTKLLRVLQEKEIRRVGSTKPVPVDVRIIAATNANLEQKVKEGTFREDLYYRLNVIPIYIPPLRDRIEDIPLLAHHLLHKLNQEYGRNIKDISGEALEILQKYRWPGNVRELENIIGRAIINMTLNEETITPRHLPHISAAVPGQHSDSKKVNYYNNKHTLDEMLGQAEKEILQQALLDTGGNKTLAAKKLGVSIRNLYYKLEKNHIN